MDEIERSDCNCCSGVSPATPVQIYNMPGLPAIAYRTGTYFQFRETMLSRLSDSDLPGLNVLRARQSDDFTIALLDAWAMVCDVLTFYQERIANESYRRTATEQTSLMNLARLVRYNLEPGVAADTFLAFTVDVTPGAPGFANIGIGTQAQSLPGPGELPQTFETAGSIVANAQWNAITPIQTQSQPVSSATLDILLAGTSTSLKTGDTLLVTDTAAGQFILHRVQSVQIDTALQQTHVYFESYLPPVPAPVTEAKLLENGKSETITGAFQQLQPLTDSLARQLVHSGASANQLEALAVFQGWSTNGLFATVGAQAAAPTEAVALSAQALAAPQIYALRLKASLFGQNAPDWRLFPQSVQNQYTGGAPGSDWPFTPPDPKILDLDRVYNQIIAGSFIAILRLVADTQAKAGTQLKVDTQFAKVSQVQEVTRSGYGMNLKVTRLLLDREIKQPQSLSELRQVTILAQSELLALAEFPASAPIQGTSIIVNGVFNGLSKGRLLVVTGRRTDATSETVSEIVTLDSIAPLPGNSTLFSLQDGLSNSYIPTSVTINANVVPATQGESVQNEILGSGDATQVFQTFTLRQSPLTYVQASTPEGRASTLSVFVDGIQWQEVSTLYGHGPYERIFVTHIGDDQKVTLQFGDGKTGARLPGGEDNVIALYRTGIGTQGMVKAGQISLLLTQPLGVKSVSNPLVPTGAVDPDTTEDARRNADNTVRTLGRIVSVADYETFASSYAAVAKAKATLVWNNQAKGVYITIAGPATPQNQTGTPILPGSGTYNKIYSGMRMASDPTIPLFLLTYTVRLFHVSAQVRVQPDYDQETVLKTVEQAIKAAFSFDARTFSQPVYLRELNAVSQSVPGVVTIRFTSFYRVDQPLSERSVLDGQNTNPYLEAAQPILQDDGSITPAELLLVDPVQPFDDLEVMP